MGLEIRPPTLLSKCLHIHHFRSLISLEITLISLPCLFPVNVPLLYFVQCTGFSSHPSVLFLPYDQVIIRVSLVSIFPFILLIMVFLICHTLCLHINLFIFS